MTTAPALLASLQHAGFTLRVEGERLLVYPGERLTEAQRDLVRQHKGALLQLLAYPSAAVLEALAAFGPPDFASGPVQLEEVALVRLDPSDPSCLPVPFAPAEWTALLEGIRQHNQMAAERWEVRLRKTGERDVRGVSEKPTPARKETAPDPQRRLFAPEEATQ